MRACLFYVLLATVLMAHTPLCGQDSKAAIDRDNERLWKTVLHNVDSAIAYAPTLAARAQKLKYPKGEAAAWARLGVALDMRGQADKALGYFHQAVRIQEKINDKEGLSFSYNNMGLLYFAQYDYAQALIFLKQAHEMYLAQKDYGGAAGSLINIGIIYTYQDKLPQSLENYSEAYALYRQQGDSMGVEAAIVNMGKVYYMQGNYNKALQLYTRAESILQAHTSHKESGVALYISMANTYTKTGQKAKALTYAGKALTLARALGSGERLQYVYETFHDIYLADRDYANAYRYLKLYTTIKDSVLNRDRQQAIAGMQVRYETAKKDKELALTRLRVSEEKELRMSRERDAEQADRRSLVFICLLSVAVFAAVFIWLALRANQRAKHLLAEKNVLAEENVRQKETMMGEMHHRVKNNLQLVSSMLDMQQRNLADKNAQRAIQESQDRVTSIALMHQYLYQGNNLHGVNMQTYLQQLAANLEKSIKPAGKNIGLVLDVDPVALHIDTGIPIGLIVNEAITNAYKYAFAHTENGKIHLSLKEASDKLVLDIHDDGAGMPPEKVNAASFGMNMMQSLARQLKANWQTQATNGTRHTFTITHYKKA